LAKEPERILLVRTDRLGDVILTLPMIGVLRKQYPHAAISMLLQHYTGEIVQGHRELAGILWYDGDGRPVPFFAMLRSIRAHRFDAVVVARPTPRLAWLMFLARIPVRIGTGYRAYSFLFNSRVFEHRKDARRHELEYNLNLLLALGVRAEALKDPVVYGLRVSPEDEKSARDVLARRGLSLDHPFAVIHPGTGGSAREWQIGNLSELGRRICRQKKMAVVVTGNAAERSLAETLAGQIGSGSVSVAGELTMKQLAAVLERARIWIGHSTGPLHLAVALGTPVVGLYPQMIPMSPRRWGPYTPMSRVHVPDRPADCTKCEDGKLGHCPCMDTITVNEVFRSVNELLTESGLEGA
jgi:heptosyltransferase III